MVRNQGMPALLVSCNPNNVLADMPSRCKTKAYIDSMFGFLRYGRMIYHDRKQLIMIHRSQNVLHKGLGIFDIFDNLLLQNAEKEILILWGQSLNFHVRN